MILAVAISKSLRLQMQPMRRPRQRLLRPRLQKHQKIPAMAFLTLSQTRVRPTTVEGGEVVENVLCRKTQILLVSSLQTHSVIRTAKNVVEVAGEETFVEAEVEAII